MIVLELHMVTLFILLCIKLQVFFHDSSTSSDVNELALVVSFISTFSKFAYSDAWQDAELRQKLWSM